MHAQAGRARRGKPARPSIKPPHHGRAHTLVHNTDARTHAATRQGGPLACRAGAAAAAGAAGRRTHGIDQSPGGVNTPSAPLPTLPLWMHHTHTATPLVSRRCCNIGPSPAPPPLPPHALCKRCPAAAPAGGRCAAFAGQTAAQGQPGGRAAPLRGPEPASAVQCISVPRRRQGRRARFRHLTTRLATHDHNHPVKHALALPFTTRDAHMSLASHWPQGPLVHGAKRTAEAAGLCQPLTRNNSAAAPEQRAQATDPTHAGALSAGVGCTTVPRGGM